jgi:hypothetical protein
MGKFIVICALVFIAIFDKAAAGAIAAIVALGYLFYTPTPKVVIRTGGSTVKKKERGREAPPDC